MVKFLILVRSIELSNWRCYGCSEWITTIKCIKIFASLLFTFISSNCLLFLFWGNLRSQASMRRPAIFHSTGNVQLIRKHFGKSKGILSTWVANQFVSLARANLLRGGIMLVTWDHLIFPLFTVHPPVFTRVSRITIPETIPVRKSLFVIGWHDL